MSQRAILRDVALVLTLYASLPVVAGGQTRVDNPKQPPAKNAGRVVQLEEVLRIRDDGGKVIFRTPRDLALGPDGSLYFTDDAGSPVLYRFGPKGELMLRLLKKGQGPGEVQYPSGFLVTPGLIRVLAWVPPKIIDFGLDGRYLREARVAEDTHGLWYLRQAAEKIYGIRDELFSSKTFNTSGSSPFFVVPNSIYEISPDFKTWKKLYEFPVRMMMKRRSGLRLDPIGAAIGGAALYVVHTAEYRVTEIDLLTGRAKRIITRAYDRIRARPAGPEDEDPETRGIELPEDPYVWDIDKIHAAAGKLWVFTSAVKPDGDDQQVDVFDGDGRYIDNVVLRYPAGSRNHRYCARWTLLTDDGFFVVPEQEEDGLVTIGKYRIRDAGLFPPRAALK